LGEVDILVNNAGHVNLSGGVLLETAADWDRVIETLHHADLLQSCRSADFPRPLTKELDR